MTEAETFLVDIWENPEDDTPRLVYADWLMDRDDPRGEFIALQCELETRSIKDPSHARLRRRELALLREHREEWLGDLADARAPLTFRRGFLDEVEMTGERFLYWLPSLWRAGPLTSIRLKRCSIGYLQTICSCKEIRSLRTLDLSYSYLNDLSVEILARSPHFKDLKTLNLSHNFIRSSGALMLVQSENFSSLKRLDLRSNQFNREALEQLRDRFGEALLK